VGKSGLLVSRGGLLVDYQDLCTGMASLGVGGAGE